MLVNVSVEMRKIKSCYTAREGAICALYIPSVSTASHRTNQSDVQETQVDIPIVEIAPYLIPVYSSRAHNKEQAVAIHI